MKKIIFIVIITTLIGKLCLGQSIFNSDTLLQIEEGKICIPFNLHLNFTDYEDFKDLDSIRIEIYSLNDNTKDSTYDEIYLVDGILDYTIYAGYRYDLIAYKPGYFAKRFSFENCLKTNIESNTIFCAYGIDMVKGNQASIYSNRQIFGLIKMEKIKVNKTFVLKNIYYDLDKYYIRKDAARELDKLVIIALDNPSLTFELSSHCDSRGSDEYNMTLSQNRAESAVAYLVSKGVSSSRLQAKGYGESQLINQCYNNIKCSETKHQENRRTEFKVIGIDKAIQQEIEKLEKSRIK